jgi:hypothetical protein
MSAPRSIKELLATPSSNTELVEITPEERKLLDEVCFQPVKEPLQAVGGGKVKFIGFNSDFERNVHHLEWEDVDSGVRSIFWFRRKAD